MARWFAKLMQEDHAGSPRATAADEAPSAEARDPRYDIIVRQLREREVEDRAGREKRQRGYRQSLESEAAVAGSAWSPASPVRLYKFPTKVPCRTTPEARALLDQLRKRSSGCTVSFPQLANGRQAVMLTGAGGTDRKQIGWVEHCVQTDPKLCNVSNQGLSVESDGGTMLVLRFRYPRTAVTMGSRRAVDDTPSVDFAEVRPVLDLRPADRGSSPRLAWVTRPEIEMLTAVGSREYEAFYVRFKRELLGGIWISLSGLLASSPASQLHRGSYYTVLREPDPANGRIHQRTIDDSGRAAEIGADRVYDAAPATDILLLYLDGDILADIADIYFTLQSLGSGDAYFLKEELFTVVRRFWAGAKSLAWRYGTDQAAVVRMCQRALPTPYQAALLKQDWINLRQSLVDRYGEGGRKAPDLAGKSIHRPRTGPAGWPFASYPAGEINLGLRVIYRQEWRERVERLIERGDTAMRLDEIMNEAVRATVEAMKWPVDVDGSINTGVRALAATTDMGMELEYRACSRDTSARLSDLARRLASSARDEMPPEVLTRPAEIQNVILVAEKLPAPAEIDLAWVRRHGWILTKALLDESFRDALNAIGLEAKAPDLELEGRRERLYEHLRANILHYQRAIWQHEDPQQRSLRYRKSGRKVPLEWRFELESGGALTVEELGDRLTAANVDAQFAAYSGGREADLDQVIDPTGPIGYYGNYAAYRMRPELGSEDLFSMLHFFKSPYLRPNSETGEPEVGDPAETRPVPSPAERSDEGLESPAAPDEYSLIIGGGEALQHLSASGRRDVDAEWMIRRNCGKPTPSLVASSGAPAARLQGDGEEPVILTPSDELYARVLLAGRAGDPDEERLLAAGAMTLTASAGIGALDAGKRTILPAGDHERTPELLAGAGAAEAHDQRMLIVPDAGELRISSAPVAATVQAPERLILSRADEERTLTLRAGRASGVETELVIVARVEGERVPGLRAGPARDAAPERMILGRTEVGPLATTLVGGGALDADAQVVLPRGERERMLRAGAARAHDPEARRVIVAAGDGNPTTSLLAGSGVARVRDPEAERVILARGDGERTLSLLAGGGGGAARAHDREIERTILAREDDEWLRPSLVAG